MENLFLLDGHGRNETVQPTSDRHPTLFRTEQIRVLLGDR
jgi:hypothetical protein